MISASQEHLVDDRYDFRRRAAARVKVVAARFTPLPHVDVDLHACVVRHALRLKIELARTHNRPAAGT